MTFLMANFLIEKSQQKQVIPYLKVKFKFLPIVKRLKVTAHNWT